MQQMRMEGQELVGNRTTKDVYDAIEERVKNRGFSDLPLDHAIDVETMRSRLHRMVHEVYSMPGESTGIKSFHSVMRPSIRSITT